MVFFWSHHNDEFPEPKRLKTPGSMSGNLWLTLLSVKCTIVKADFINENKESVAAIFEAVKQNPDFLKSFVGFVHNAGGYRHPPGERPSIEFAQDNFTNNWPFVSCRIWWHSVDHHGPTIIVHGYWEMSKSDKSSTKIGMWIHFFYLSKDLLNYGRPPKLLNAPQLQYHHQVEICTQYFFGDIKIETK